MENELIFYNMRSNILLYTNYVIYFTCLLGLAVMMAIAGIYMKFKGGAIVQCSKCNARYKINKYDYDQYKKKKKKAKIKS